jgi:hypothetical protein
VGIALLVMSRGTCQACQQLGQVRWLTWGKMPLTIPACKECSKPLMDHVLNRIEEPMKREDKGGI